MKRFVLRSLGKVHDRAVHSRRVRVLAHWLGKLIPHGDRVLDVGCGDGLIDRLVLDQRPDITIRGVDVFVRPNAHIPVDVFDGLRLPFPDGAFDTVMVCDVLHHTPSPVASLRDIARVAARDVVVKDHVVAGIGARPTLRFMDFVGNAPHGVVLPYNYLTAAQWHSAFANAGLKADEVYTSLGLYPWWADWLFGRGMHFAGRYKKDPAAKVE